ncbi:MAG: 7-cyano-7-deazaguanine synthase QueC [Candidatus Omnitrophota bacterium]
MKKAVILLSGGLDSAVTLYLVKSLKFKCFCLIFNYGQRHKKEVDCAKNLARLTNSVYFVLDIYLPWGGSVLLDKNKPLPKDLDLKKRGKRIPDTYVPARNILFLSYALSFAEAKGAKDIFIGANAIDYSGYPDCRPGFIKQFNKLAEIGTKSGASGAGIRIHAPLINKTKAEIVKLGCKLKVPFEVTWSCYAGQKHPCGRCDSCRFRRRGFREAGIKDPLVKNQH